MFKHLSVLSISQIRGLKTCALLLGTLGLTGCPENEAPNHLSNGSNGFVYASPDFSQVQRHSASPAGTQTIYESWIDPSLETFRWVSRWGVDKPWCSLIAPSRNVNWTEHAAKGGQKPSPRLRCLDAQGQALASVDLPHAFMRATIDPSGKHVLLYTSEKNESASNLVFVGNPGLSEPLINRKLAAVVDLPSGTLRTLTIEGFGAEVEDVRFPEVQGEGSTVDVEGRTRRLAMFMARGELVLVDLNDPSLSQLAVTTRAGLSEDTPRVKLIPARPGLPQPLLLIAGNQRDIQQLRLRARKDRPQALDADYSILTTTYPAMDFETFDIEGAPWLLSATRAGLSMINLQSSEETLVPEMGLIEQISSYRSADGRTMVLASPNQGTVVSVIEPAKALTSLGRKPTQYRVGAGFTKILDLGKHRIAAIGTTTITVIDLDTGKRSPLGGLENPSKVVYPGNDFLYLVVPTVNAGQRTEALARVNLNTMVSENHPIEATLLNQSPMMLVNGKQDLAFRVWDQEENRFGIASIRVNAAQLSELSTTFFEN